VGRLGGRGSLGERHDAFGDARPQRRDARGACFIVQEAVVTCRHEAFLPAPHTGLRLASPAHDLIGANTVRAQQDDLARQTCLCGVLRSRASAFRRGRSAGLRVMEIPVRMRQTRMHLGLGEFPSRIQMSDAIH
jgi:hypothetical protein